MSLGDYDVSGIQQPGYRETSRDTSGKMAHARGSPVTYSSQDILDHPSRYSEALFRHRRRHRHIAVSCLC